MEQLKQMLEAYRNGERPMPTYAELAAIAEANEPVVAALRSAEGLCEEACFDQHPDNQCWLILEEVRAALVGMERAK